MRVRVEYTVPFSDEQRRALAYYNDGGQTLYDESLPTDGRLATREEVKDFLFSLGVDNGMDLLQEFL